MPSPSAERTKHAYCTCTDVPMTFDEQTELWTWKCSRCDVEFHGKESHKLEAQGRRHVRKHHAQAVNSPVAQKHRGKLCWPCTVCKCKITADTKARLKDRRRLRIDGFHPDCDVSQFLTLGGKPAGSQRPGPKRVKALLDAAKQRALSRTQVHQYVVAHHPRSSRLDCVNVNSYINAAECCRQPPEAKREAEHLLHGRGQSKQRSEKLPHLAAEALGLSDCLGART